MKFYDWPSPNFGERKNGGKPELIVIHYTASASLSDALLRLCDPLKEVSAHYLIAENGDVFRLVAEEKRAWHAGEASWQGDTDVNSHSIGIEIQNKNGEPYTGKQLASLAILCHDLMARHGIAPENVIGHSDVAPHRKIDPGAHFPWGKFAEHGIGARLRPTLKDKFGAASLAKKPADLKKLFRAAGYGVDAYGRNKPTLRQLTLAFQQHFEPKAFKTGAEGKPTAETVAKLRALIRRQNALRKKKP